MGLTFRDMRATEDYSSDNAPPPAYSTLSFIDQHCNRARSTSRSKSQTQRTGASSTNSSASSSTPSSSPLSTPNVEEEVLINEYLGFSHRPHHVTSADHKPLCHPVAVPQIINGTGMPFTRAWAPELAAHDITAEEFLTFIDNLNIVSTAAPPFQLVSMTGMVVGGVPLPFFGLAGTATKGLASAGTIVTSKLRQHRYLKHSNQEFWNPRGLHAQIYSGDEFRRRLGILGSSPVVPLEDLPSHDQSTMTLVHRQLHAVGPLVSRLQLQNLPEPNDRSNILVRLSFKQVFWDANKRERKLVKERANAVQSARNAPPELESLPSNYHSLMDAEARAAQQVRWLVITSIQS